jgi:hypothetical protein
MQKKALPLIRKSFVELWGFEPQTFALPARRSSQLSYSPQKGLKYKSDGKLILAHLYFLFDRPQRFTIFIQIAQLSLISNKTSV